MSNLTIKKARELGRVSGRDHDGFADMDSNPCSATAAQHGKRIARQMRSARDSSVSGDVRGLSAGQKKAYFEGFASGIAKTYRDDPRYRRCGKH